MKGWPGKKPRGRGWSRLNQGRQRNPVSSFRLALLARSGSISISSESKREQARPPSPYPRKFGIHTLFIYYIIWLNSDFSLSLSHSQSIYLSIYLSICLSIYLSIYLTKWRTEATRRIRTCQFTLPCSICSKKTKIIYDLDVDEYNLKREPIFVSVAHKRILLRIVLATRIDGNHYNYRPKRYEPRDRGRSQSFRGPASRLGTNKDEAGRSTN